MRTIYWVPTVLLLVLVFCNGESDESLTVTATGTISVSVVDNDPAETPIPGVEITLTPLNIKKATDAHGMCVFPVSVGDYYVEADVCCAGPGNIHYHESVTVVENDTTTIKLTGCLSCL
jgi:hypothetical protein